MQSFSVCMVILYHKKDLKSNSVHTIIKLYCPRANNVMSSKQRPTGVVSPEMQERNPRYLYTVFCTPDTHF